MIDPENAVEISIDPFYSSLNKSYNPDKRGYAKFFPSNKLYSVPYLGIDNVYYLFKDNFFETMEMYYGCFLFMESHNRPFFFTIPCLQFLSQKDIMDDLWTMYYSLTKIKDNCYVNSRILNNINKNRAYSPIVVHNWKTETYMIIEFAWASNRQTEIESSVDIVFTYTNKDLKISYGNWRINAMQFLDYLENYFPRFIKQTAETSSYYHYV